VRKDPLRESAVLRRIYGVKTRGAHGPRNTSSFERSLMGGRVDAQRESADNNTLSSSEFAGNAASGCDTCRRCLTGSNERNDKRGGAEVPSDVQRSGRIGKLGKRDRIRRVVSCDSRDREIVFHASVLYNRKRTGIVTQLSAPGARITAVQEFKKHVLVELAIIGGIVVVFGGFSYLFRLNIEKKADVVTMLQTKKTLLSGSIQNLSQLVNDWNTARRYTRAVEKLVPQKDQLVALSKDFIEIARANGIALNFSFGTEQNPEGNQQLGSIGFSATAAGSLANILSFFEALESKYYAMQISAIEVTANQEGGRHTAIFGGKVFFVTQ